jgi:multidrug resistance efflux pump
MAGTAVAAMLALSPVGYLILGRRSAADPRTVGVERRPFTQVIRRQGTLQPAVKTAIFSKIAGTLLQVADDGSRVEKGGLLFQLDPKPNEEQLIREQASLRRVKAEWERDRQTAAKELRKVQDEAASRKLRVDLETLRLKEIEEGPTPTEEVNAKTALENAKILCEARKEEYEVLAGLARDGFVSQVEARQKELEATEQGLKVTEADIAYRKLHTLDPVKIAEQKLKVRDEEKNLAAAKEKAELLSQNLARAAERAQDRVKHEEQDVAETKGKIAKTRCVAPTPGVVLYNPGRRGWGIGPGRDVWEGHEIMTVSDLRRMKAVLTVDEGRIGAIQKEQRGRVRAAGLEGATFEGRVTRVAEKGQDEFESLEQETQDLTGKANRQVFEVEVELDESAPDLRPGLRVEVEIVIRELADALVVPRSGVFKNTEKQTCVRAVTARGGEEPRVVKIVAEDELYCAVEGLAEGERVWRAKP